MISKVSRVGEAEMTVFDNGEDDFAEMNNASGSLIERKLVEINQAYAQGGRESCIRLVNDLYAFFDRAAGTAITSCLISSCVLSNLLTAMG